jgi:hypothetical protein
VTGKLKEDSPSAVDASGHPLFISGSHQNRTVWWARVIETSVAVVIASWLFALFLIPRIALPLAWTLLAIYVLAGFAMTLFRLIPLRMS